MALQKWHGSGGAPTSTEFPTEWGESSQSGDATWRLSTRLVDVPLDAAEASFLTKTIRSYCPSSTLEKVTRIQNRGLWQRYSRCRDGEIKASSADGLANEKYLFHGTGRLSAEEVIRHPKGLDPGFSKGGFFGRGIYLAANPAYPIGGRYAHRLPGSDGRRIQLLVVRAALGTAQELGSVVSAETMNMQMPGVRVETPFRMLYNSVRGGPHRPFVAGPGVDASIVHVVYEARQMYPAYIVELTVADGGGADSAHLAGGPAVDDPEQIAACIAQLTSGHQPSVKAGLAETSLIVKAIVTRAQTLYMGVIGPLISVLRSGDAQSKCLAAAALSNLAIGSAERRKNGLCQAGAIEPLVLLLGTGNVMAKGYAAMGLWNLAHGSEQRTAAVAAAGSTGPLVQLLRTGDAKSKSYAAGALGKLTVGSEQRRAAIAAAGAVGPLIQLLGTGDVEGKSYAALVLGNLAHGSDQRCAAMVTAGVTAPLVRLLGTGDVQGQAYAAEALGSLAYGSEQRSAAVAAAGGIGLLAALLGKGAKKQAVRALKHLAEGPGGLERMAAMTAAGVPWPIQ